MEKAYRRISMKLAILIKRGRGLKETVFNSLVTIEKIIVQFMQNGPNFETNFKANITDAIYNYLANQSTIYLNLTFNQ